MRKIPKKILPEPMRYSEKKRFFSDKEIIFRSNGRARVLKISSRVQIIALLLVLFLAIWSVHSYHMYHRSGRILNRRNNELTATRDAYIDLMSNFVTLQNNISQMIENIDETNNKSLDVEQYKQQASLVEEKVKKITSDPKLINNPKLEEKTNINEVSLQRDIAVSERNEMRKKLVELQTMVEDMRAAEIDVIDKVSQIAEREMNKIKNAVKEINAPLKKRGMYFNINANNKKQKGRAYNIPNNNKFLKEKKVGDKVSKLYKTVDDVAYYREVMSSVPIGRPAWNTKISSYYGSRRDPMKRRKSYHKGVDLSGRTGNKILSPAKGKVLHAGYNKGGYGNVIEIDHGNGFVTRYAHLKKSYVKRGQRLDIGQTIGELGSTGRSTGPHLHYEILYRGRDVDPLPFIRAKIS